MGSSVDVGGYLRRLGLSELAGAGPGVEGLRALHRAHAERVPYECLEIWLGRATSVDPVESAGRILRGRGGYCFHLNGAFSLLLRTLGYRVSRHVGGVQPTAEFAARASGDHLVLTVAGLSSAEAPDGRWLVDLGMGDGLHEPLPLVPGEYRQGPFTYRLRRSEAVPGGWRFDHDPRGAFLGMDFEDRATDMAVFAPRHLTLSTSPDSGFVRTLTVQRRDARGADVLRGLVLTRVGESARAGESGRAGESARAGGMVIDRPDDFFAVLADVFGLVLDDVPAAERAALWRRLVAAHELWAAS